MQARSSHLGDGRSSAGLANPLSGVSDDDWFISAWISFTLSLKAFLVVFELLKPTAIATNIASLRNAAWFCHVHVTWTQATYISACGFIVSRDARSRQHHFSSFLTCFVLSPVTSYHFWRKFLTSSLKALTSILLLPSSAPKIQINYKLHLSSS